MQTAVIVAASADKNINGDFCKVTGIVKPRSPDSPNLEFEVNLPLTWNRRALQMGGEPNNITAADVNGDGRTDLVVSDLGSGSVSVFLHK